MVMSDSWGRRPGGKLGGQKVTGKIPENFWKHPGKKSEKKRKNPGKNPGKIL